jgi:hypothetical protein
MRLSETAQVFVAFGASERTLLDLIDGWCGHVMKLADDLLEEATEDPWTVHDFIASLYIRDAVQRGMEYGDMRNVTISAVAAADEVLRSITIEDQQGLLASCDPDVPATPWWWGRVPARGPIDAEIRQIVERETK